MPNKSEWNHQGVVNISSRSNSALMFFLMLPYFLFNAMASTLPRSVLVLFFSSSCVVPSPGVMCIPSSPYASNLAFKVFQWKCLCRRKPYS